MLREEAYVAERLERQLEEQASRFLSDRSRNRYRDGRLEVSKIFAKLLAENTDDQRLITEGKAALAFLEYDWALNDFPSSSRR